MLITKALTTVIQFVPLFIVERRAECPFFKIDILPFYYNFILPIIYQSESHMASQMQK